MSPTPKSEFLHSNPKRTGSPSMSTTSGQMARSPTRRSVPYPPIGRAWTFMAAVTKASASGLLSRR